MSGKYLGAMLAVAFASAGPADAQWVRVERRPPPAVVFIPPQPQFVVPYQAVLRCVEVGVIERRRTDYDPWRRAYVTVVWYEKVCVRFAY